jgi:hypothetical protein
MGAKAAAANSKRSARKQGKKYLWGSERPGVLERRVQIRMEQLPEKLAAVEERVARFREAELAKIEAERIFLEHQQALLNEHREEVRAKKLLRVPDPGHHSEEEIAAVIARTPEIPLSDRAARQILDIIKSQAQVAEAPFDVVAVSPSGRIHVLETPNGRGETDPVRSVTLLSSSPQDPARCHTLKSDLKMRLLTKRSKSLTPSSRHLTYGSKCSLKSMGLTERLGRTKTTRSTIRLVRSYVLFAASSFGSAMNWKKDRNISANKSIPFWSPFRVHLGMLPPFTKDL